MHSDTNVSEIPTNRWKKSRWMTQIINGIISFSLGITTLHLNRPHKYVYGGTYCADSNYPYMIDDVTHNDIIPEPLSFLSKYSPVLSAIIVNIISSIFLFNARLNKDIKLWVKIVIFFLNVAWLLFAAIIPSQFLPAIEHPLYTPLTCTYLYGVYRNKDRNSHHRLMRIKKQFENLSI